tara:strand:+ start:551 stop:736 length:186 start_codon:yes stop_codon:yes gene_type:complete
VYLARPRRYNGMLPGDIVIFKIMWTQNKTYEQADNGSLPTNYWTQTTTWDEDFNPKTTAEN